MSNDYFLSGIVIKGDGRGRSLGFATANLELDNKSTPPPPGIYACWVTIYSTQRYQAVLHFGPRPTFPGSTSSVEVHLLNYQGQDLYDQTVTCEGLIKIRTIFKFNSPEDLKEIIRDDIAIALKELV